ncbi:MAG: DinB family protein, partial [Planctomycetota bacterium]
MPRWPWIERKFSFDFPPEKMPDLIERVRGTPVRVEALVAGLPPDVLTRSDGKGWSIQQNVGHLLDLGYLAVTRIDQILAGETTLIAADMTNRKTNRADHNAADFQTLLAAFTAERAQLVAKLEALQEADWGKSALHPRLQR